MMTTSPILPAAVTTNAHVGRWAALLVLSVLLHLLVLGLANRGLGQSSVLPPAPVITASLAMPAASVVLPLTAPVTTIEPEPVPKKTRRKATPRTAVVTPPTTPTATAAAAVTAQANPDTADAIDAAGTVGATPAAPAAPAPEPDPAPVTPPATVPVAVAAAAATDASPMPRYAVDLPPSATLDYEVRYATRNSVTRGSSSIAWHADDGAYTIRGEVSKFGFALSSFRSSGSIDDAGVAPVLYAEKNARRSETNTHFLRDARQAISFSAATDTYPLASGAQDRASILWQLSGIARGDRSALIPGAVLEVYVAGTRDAERWLIRVEGEETIDLETGQIRAWHLVRTPRAGTYDKRIDIWLAPEQQWYPVKLRYTEANGDYLDLTMAALRAGAAR